MQLNHSLVGKKLGRRQHTLAGGYLSERSAYIKLVWQREWLWLYLLGGRGGGQGEEKIREKETQIAIKNEHFVCSLGVHGGDRAYTEKKYRRSSTRNGVTSRSTHQTSKVLKVENAFETPNLPNIIAPILPETCSEHLQRPTVGRSRLTQSPFSNKVLTISGSDFKKNF